jgi:hypothetical protein
MLIRIVFSLLCVLTTAATAQASKAGFQAPKSFLTMERSLEKYGIAINKESTLKREWFVIRDELAPAAVDGLAGFSVLIGVPTSPSPHQYQVPYQIKAKEPVTAVELRVHSIDVFGKVVTTLSDIEVCDISDTHHFVANWPVRWSHSEPLSAYASVVYVAQARTAAGKVYEVDRTALLDQMRKIAKKLTEDDLEPNRGAANE